MEQRCRTCKHRFIDPNASPCASCLRDDTYRNWEPAPQAAFPGAVIDDAPGGSTPSQYGLPDGAKELQDLIEYRHMNFALGNIFKACYRRGTCSHSDELRDMRKIKWFAEREIARLEKENGNA